ncbi:MAG TPA: S41 family peptidase [Bacteroidales bacterium]|nr:S41 family peptidase [Bacteroidales bacterium]
MSIFKRIRKGWKIAGISVVLSSLLFLYAFNDSDFKILKNLDIFYTLFRELNLYYVDDTDPERLIKTSIDGMLQSLDPYTVYIPENEADDYRILTTGQYGGIGATTRKIGGYVVVADIYENSPADKADIKTGDIIHEIDGQPLYFKESAEISELLKGEPGTDILLTIERPDENKLIKKNVKREKISLSNVPYYGMVNDEVGYIKLMNFTGDAHKEVRQAMSDLKEKQGAKSLILDLRGNPGGLLIEAVDVVNLFIHKGQEVVSTKGKMKQWDNVYKTRNQPYDTQIPVVVLVNRSSASSAEIVAGAMQDLDRAVIIGQRTYGKGLVQTTRPLSYNAQLKVTTAKYYIPSGRCIQSLDYSKRSFDGSASYIPDSLIAEFNTKNGRKVYDGGGIVPDIQMSPETLSKISISLYTRGLFFNYATSFYHKTDSIPSVPKFRVDDAIFKNFVEYISAKNFDYVSETEQFLEKLQEIAKAEKYYDNSKQEFENLMKKISHDKFKDLEDNKEEISELLQEEIASRYYFQKGRIATSLTKDTHVQKGIEVLSNRQLYSNILNGSVKSDMASKKVNYQYDQN